MALNKEKARQTLGEFFSSTGIPEDLKDLEAMVETNEDVDQLRAIMANISPERMANLANWLDSLYIEPPASPNSDS